MYGPKINDTKFYGDQYRWFVGVVVEEFAADPDQLGRVKVRIAGIHDNDQILDADLPWATVAIPTNTSGTLYGNTVPRLLRGAQVTGFFADGMNAQQPIVTGAIPFIANPTAAQLRNSRYQQAYLQPDPLAAASASDVDLPPDFDPATSTGKGLVFESHTDPRILPELMNVLERIAGRIGKTLSINSAYRSPAYNARVGGAKNSQHIQGRAVDFRMGGWSQDERLEAMAVASAEGIKGIGIYSNTLHVDIRTSGRAAWGPTYRRASVPGYASVVIGKHLRGEY